MKLVASTPYISIKVIWYKFPSRRAITTMFPFVPPTMHSFMWNYIFNPFNKNLLIKNKLACKFYSVYLMFNSHDNGIHSDGFNHAIITQVHVAWKNHLVGVKCCPMWSHVLCGSQNHDSSTNAPWMCSMLRCKCEFILILCIFGILPLSILHFVAKSYNVSRFALMEACSCALRQKYFIIKSFIGIFSKAMIRYSYDSVEFSNKVIRMFLSHFHETNSYMM